METKARYVLIGVFTLAVIFGSFAFVYWMQGRAGSRERVVYRVRFETSVSGLAKGASVAFNGVRVGEVTSIALDRDNPQQVMATIAVEPGTPIHADTRVGLDFQGLMGGVATIALSGGTPTSPILSGPRTEPPVLVASAASSQTMSQLARDALGQLTTILTDNGASLHSTIANLETFSGALARNSDRLNGIMAGLERMVGGAPSKPVPIYDLSARRTFPPSKAPQGQLVIPEPTALIEFDSQKIVERSKDGESSSLANAQWSDNLPKLVQARVVQSFENANDLRWVARPMEGLTADRQLLIDIRDFEVLLLPEPTAKVEFSAKILGADGKIVDARIFSASVAAEATDVAARVAALDQAFGKAVTELVVWTLGVS